LTTWGVIEKDDPRTMRDITPTQFRLENTAQAAFEFMPMPLVRLGEVKELDIKFQAQGPYQLELWNWSTQLWEPVNVLPDTNTTTITNPDQYIGPENAVHVRLSLTDTSAYNQVDYIKVAYRGHLAQ
jgi:hypothetical protein